MTVFAFNTFNHCPQGQCIVEDITRVMGHQMMALGHEAHWRNDGFIPGADGYNVILESFADDPRTLHRIAEAHAAGCRFIYIATEEPTATGFNHGLEPAMIDRQNAFPAAARYADGILHLIPGGHVTSWYGQFAPTACAELGYAPSLVRPDDGIEPDFDFGFFGKMTWRRQQMLSRLEQSTGSTLRIASLDVPRDERDLIMRRARVIVQIRANEEWGMVSSTRCASSLLFGRPVVAEPHPFGKPWNDVVHFANSVESFFDDALACARGNWRAWHAAQLDRFRSVMTPEACIGAPLREIGIA